MLGSKSVFNNEYLDSAFYGKNASEALGIIKIATGIAAAVKIQYHTAAKLIARDHR